jgi:micrococcal nuclease
VQSARHGARGARDDARVLRQKALAVLILLALGAFGGRALLPGDDAGPARAGEGQVTRITDGDTIRVMVGGVEEKVRYIGVDTPESVKPGTPVQCFAKAASAFNAKLVEGRRVRLETDAEARDRYGRLLAYVYREPDGLFVNAELVRGGYAQPLTIAPNVRFAERFRTLAADARRRGAGLWGAC